MTDNSVASPRVVDCAGFRIEINSEDLRATCDGSPVTAAGKRSIGAHVLHGVLLIAALSKLWNASNRFGDYLSSLGALPAILASNLSLGSRLERSLDLLLPVFLLAAFHSWYVWVLRKGLNDLHCSRNSLEVLNTYRGRVRTTTSYAPNQVKQVTFGSYGINTTSCIFFTIAGKRIRVLDGIKCVEAQIILEKLDQFGYDVVHDVGMPMMVEMEQERRKSWLA